MTIGVIGAMQMEVDDLKAQMTDTLDRGFTAEWSLLRAKSVYQYVVAAKMRNRKGICGNMCRGHDFEI